MTLVEGFIDFCKKQGIKKSDVQTYRMEDAAVFSFGQESDEQMNYNVMLILYDDNKSADIWVRKPITNSNILNKLNDLNMDYRFYTFVATDDTIVLKGSVNTNSDINVVLKEWLQIQRIANVEFKKFK
jgi:hypothetical protein